MSPDKTTDNHIPIRFTDEDENRISDDRPTPEVRGGRSASDAEERDSAMAYADAESGVGRIDETGTSGDVFSFRAAENNDDREALASSEIHDSLSGSAHNAPAVVDASGPAMAELVATRAELRRVEVELQKVYEEGHELREAAARRQADFENYRKRVERDRSESYQRTLGEVVAQLLPVVDNLRRAVVTETSVKADESEEFGRFLQGVELISKQLSGVLETFGVEPVATVGLPFDPHIHEAVAMEQSDVHEPDTVIEEIVRGYRIGGRLLRPAMVKVAK
ncbi:MAG TPA: nucleotide exchange factor GrpE [Pyrinomonadaceae bacterium]|nr:nucleotide exchange factor GrpE [Pyrinomonadaceae bacterium]